ncbi:ricin B lectin domain-containing protein [Mycena epipterygia]|nr:ricin B lectin domain-containing protein [Mycena epipterygia]
MTPSTVVALLAFVLSATASEIQTTNPAFFSSGIQGCISAAENEDGAPLVMHNCNTEATANHDFLVSFATKQNAGPTQISLVNSGRCIDVTGGVNADGTKLQIWTCGPRNANQQWISRTDGTFQWANTDKCIDLTDGNMLDGTQLQIWTCDSNNSNQKWTGAPAPDAAEVVLITGGDFSASGGGPYCLAAASDEDGAEVALVACLNSDFHTTFPNGNITWTVPVAPLIGQISTFSGTKCLDVPNGSRENGVKLQIWTCTDANTNQVWHNHGRQIEWSVLGKCIDLTDGNSTSGQPIQVWDCDTADSNPNQDWFLSSA